MDGDRDANGSNANGDGKRRHASGLFDPVAGMRAMADIQAEGLRAASELLERVLEPAHESPSTRPRPPESDYRALVDAWAALLQRVATGLVGPPESGSVTIPVDSDAPGAPLRLVVGPDRRAAEIELWLHNGTSGAVGPLALRCGPLTSPDGASLGAATVRFDPAEVDPLPPRSSRGVLMTLATSGRRRPGVYRGAVQADGAPRLWLPVEVAIEPC